MKINDTEILDKLAYTRDINNFATHKQITAFIGTDPTIYQSGTSVNIKGSISKRGNSHLRRTIWHMARAATVMSIL